MPQHNANQQPGSIATQRSARVAASRKLLRRAGRRNAAAFLADGPQAVREALRFHDDVQHSVGVHVDELFVDAELTDRHAELLALAHQASIPVRYADSPAMRSLSDAVTPQGIVARCALLDATLPQVTAGAPQLVAVPIEVRDPGNLGTIIRCADASGAGGVVVLGDSVDVHNPKVVRASAGSVFHLPVAHQSDPAAGIEALRSAGLQIVATEGEALISLDDLVDDGALARPTAWLFGNEAAGLREEIAALADIRVRIPIRGLAESLNLSTAAAVCLFASARAQR
ncbi:TrmH family RNA methyltransferase [Cumulibacter soli]|uniref:TrmH family RNA methyltransferase n=1 Tax=Cumulibacter soli TaxID=2546344 RepID=UPI001FBA7934|nr:RNA methyltransferase [Cumulibacter soli]